MKIILGLILGLCFAGLANGQILLGTDIAVNLSVEAESSKIRETVIKGISTNFWAMDKNIVIVGGSATYLVKVQIMEVKSSPGSKSNYVYSTIVTTNEYAARRNNAPELIDWLLGNSLFVSDIDQLTENISEIATFANSKIQLGENRRYS